MRPSLCHGCLAALLKFLNFFQAFTGFSILIYSLWVLNRCYRDGIEIGFSFDFHKLPAPWFVCALMGFGVLMCLIALIGHVAAEVVSGCCLCFYAALVAILILLETGLVGDLIFNKRWEEDLPYDSTGELKILSEFIEENLDIFKWVVMTVVIIQALSLLLALVVRVMIPRRRENYDSDEDFLVIRRPLLTPQAIPTYAPNSVENPVHHSDIWSSRMRQKYGLNQSS
ncbi:hypothetical protein J5N97_023482 [Dioscorea zingiberensis]|uniref:Tetraspanin-18 n=1 Tax=Dioscorea zingiberensis TaxID=325984 RepID=A0A9D5C5B7_9LILI|nr:hypothetical protein J5N97_023482 [Dioscorea zingiberensis]